MPDNRMHHILRFCFVVLFVSFHAILSAQQLRYQFKNYTPSDGLPSSEVHKVLQDAKHYMWFATDHGVCRYNGYEFKTYSLSDNSILGLYEDYKKRIWAWSFSGRLFVFENEKWEEYKWNAKFLEVNKYGVVHSLYVDSSNNVFIAANGPIAIKISPEGNVQNLIKRGKEVKIELMKTGKEEVFAYVSECPDEFISHSMQQYYSYSVKFTKNGKQYLMPTSFIFWAERIKAKKLGADMFFMERNHFLYLPSNSKSEIFENNFLTYDVEKIGDKYFYGTDEGLRIVNEKGDLEQQYLQGTSIVSIAEDNEGGIWLASLNKGVYYLNSTRLKHLSEKEWILAAKFKVLQKLNDSLIMAGTEKGDIVLLEPGVRLNQFSIGHHSIYSFYKYSNDTVFVAGSFTQGFVGPSIKFTRCYDISWARMLGVSNFLRRNDTLYINSSRILAPHSLTNKSAVPTDTKEAFRASKLFFNKKGEMLVGNNEGLWQYVNGRLERTTLKNPLLQNRITDIAEMGDSSLLLSTRGKGLLLIKNDSVLQLTEELGIASNSVRKIFVDKNYLWLATNRGVSLVQINSLVPFDYSIKNLGVKDGLLSNEVNDIIDYKNKIVFASNEGMSFVDRVALINQRSLPLPFYLSSVRLQSIKVNADDLKNIGYRRRNLAITYEAITYGNPGRINYRYRLKGYDSVWIYTNNREIQFNTVPYGSYTLQIQAKREYDQWENTVSSIELPMVCKPPFWSTTWFWVSAFSLILFLVILFFKNRIQQIRSRQRQQEELKQKANDTEQMALKAQMNPHFIFNSLNSIQQYVIDSDVTGANIFISGFSRLIRQTLEFSSKQFITLDEEISYLSTYLDLEKARMESMFVYHVNVQTKQPSGELELPPLLLQPYVENALRHGIRYLENIDGVIVLSFIEKPGLLECIIEDNGIGREKAMQLKAVNPIEYQSRGMSLTAERIALLNEGKERKIEVAIEDLKDADGRALGTRIKVLFPV